MSQLQDHLDSLKGRHAPLPLPSSEVLFQAKRLRDVGMDYTAVSQAMGVYHGEYLSVGGWVMRFKRAGLHEPKHHPNGTRRVPPVRP